jgi:hypothetical protein
MLLRKISRSVVVENGCIELKMATSSKGKTAWPNNVLSFFNMATDERNGEN